MNLNNVIYEFDNGYKIIDTYDDNGEPIRLLKSYKAIQSVSFINKKYDMYDKYSNLFDFIGLMPNVNNTLLLGGGGFSYPKYYIYKYPEKKMDVVEINEEVIEASYKYFFIDDLYNEYDKERKRLNITCDDCLHYIDCCDKKYDAIFFDVYDDMIANKNCSMDYFNKKIFNLINEDGYYFINYIFYKDNICEFDVLMNNLLKYFKNYKIITTRDVKGVNSFNIFIVFSNNIIILPKFMDYNEYSFEEIKQL